MHSHAFPCISFPWHQRCPVTAVTRGDIPSSWKRGSRNACILREWWLTNPLALWLCPSPKGKPGHWTQRLWGHCRVFCTLFREMTSRIGTAAWFPGIWAVSNHWRLPAIISLLITCHKLVHNPIWHLAKPIWTWALLVLSGKLFLMQMNTSGHFLHVFISCF